jgi:hypothetical protein
MPLELFLVGPLLALAVLAAFAVSADLTGRKPGVRRPTAPEFGLLVPVAVSADLGAARAIRRRLVGRGIRATVGTGHDGLVRVLVFVDEYDRARDAV